MQKQSENATEEIHLQLLLLLLLHPSILYVNKCIITVWKITKNVSLHNCGFQVQNKRSSFRLQLWKLRHFELIFNQCASGKFTVVEKTLFENTLTLTIHLITKRYIK